MYALASNYGGLVARMILRPIEDSSRNLFARLCHSSTSTSTSSSNMDKRSSSPKSNSKPPSSLSQASLILSSLLKLYTLASLPLLVLGPPLCPILLNFLAGPRFSTPSTISVLQTYIFSIPLLALNGVSEAFVAAAASPKELQRQSFYMGIFSMIFAGVTVVFLGVLNWGARGLVLANCVNLGMRVGFNLEFATRFFAGEGVRFRVGELLPSSLAVAVTAVVAGVVRSTEGVMGERFGVVGEMGRIGGLGVLLGGVL
jgi:oligosaccharide translocation protein RFT1